MGKHIKTTQSEFITENNTNTIIGYDVQNMVLEIPKQKRTSFDKVIKKVERLCKYIGIPLPKINKESSKTYYVIQHQNPDNYVVNTYFETLTTDAKVALNYLNNDPKYKGERYFISKGYVDVIDLDIVVDIKPDNEWIILGVIDHKEKLLRAAPNQTIPFDKIPKDLSNCSCDHCKTERVRNKTVFIQNLESKEIIRVGGSCIKYYLGANFEKILEFLSDINDLLKASNESEFEDDSNFRHRYSQEEDNLFDVKNIVKYFFYHVRKYGYISTTSAEKINLKKGEDAIQTESSKDAILNIVRNYIIPPYGRNVTEKDIIEFNKGVEEFNKIVNSETDDKYLKLLDFVEANYKENNFLFNVKNMIDAGSVVADKIRYIISACSMYEGKIQYEEYKKKSDEEKAEAHEKLVKTSNWIGVVGEKSKVENLEITNIRSFMTEFGESTVYKLVDKEGNIYTKFGTINKKFVVNDKEVEVGAVISATAEIKKHDVFNDVKQTVLGRLSKI